MRTGAVTCGACGHGWPWAGAGSVYEREAVESRPCPRCGAYTLRCPEPTTPPRTRRTADAVRRLRVTG